MDEVLGAIADAVSQLVIAFADSEEKNTLFADMVPAAEVINGAVQVCACFYTPPLFLLYSDCFSLLTHSPPP